MQGDQYGRSALAQKLLGPWGSASRAARADLSRFLQLVSRILGGEASSQEVEVHLSFPKIKEKPDAPMRILHKR